MSVRHIHARKGEYIAVHREGSYASESHGCAGTSELDYPHLCSAIGVIYAILELFFGSYGFFDGLFFLLFGPFLYMACGYVIGCVIQIITELFK